MTNESSIVHSEPEAKTAAGAPGQECCGPTGRARTSKIARLPADIRAELNERLLEAEPPAAILEWLNALPEVQRVLAQSFDSQPITEVNLSRWRQGGYAGWLEQRNTQEAVEAVATAAAGVEGPAAENLNRHLAVVLSARLFVEMQRCGAMPEGPDKTASLHQLVMSYTLLRRAEYYGEKVRLDREKLKMLEERLRQEAEKNRKRSPEEQEDRTNKILGTGRFAANWNNNTRQWEGPGAAMRYKEEEVTLQVRTEMKRRYPNGFPEGYRPPYGDPLPVYPKPVDSPKSVNHSEQKPSIPARSDSDSPPNNPVGNEERASAPREQTEQGPARVDVGRQAANEHIVTMTRGDGGGQTHLNRIPEGCQIVAGG